MEVTGNSRGLSKINAKQPHSIGRISGTLFWIVYPAEIKHWYQTWPYSKRNHLFWISILVFGWVFIFFQERWGDKEFPHLCLQTVFAATQMAFHTSAEARTSFKSSCFTNLKIHQPSPTYLKKHPEKSSNSQVENFSSHLQLSSTFCHVTLQGGKWTGLTPGEETRREIAMANHQHLFWFQYRWKKMAWCSMAKMSWVVSL